MDIQLNKSKVIAIAIFVIAILVFIFKNKKSMKDKRFEFIKSVEGLRLYAYQDSAGKWTIGFGSTVVNGNPVKKGDMISIEMARQSLEDWFAKNKIVMPREKLSVNQQVALYSFAYNIGKTGYNKSAVYAYLRDTKPSQVDNEHLYKLFLAYTNYHDVNGVLRHSKGLENRRIKEYNLFIS